ncbi:helix-turn-helix transcriptional regulator, partial [Streptomyces sp. SID3343]|nr:helix-turn-helix transcriptional regulator [Streptomyces sp. SID3343]
DSVGPQADTDLAAKVRYTLASNLMNVDNLRSAYEYSSQALALIPADPPSRTWVWAAATHVQAAYYVLEYETARTLGAEALAAAEALGARDAQADVLITLTGMRANNRQTPEGRERLRQASELAREAGNATIELRALYSLAMGCFEAGYLADCLGCLDDALERARATGQASSPWALDMRYLRALALYTSGRWDDAVAAAAGVAPAAFGHVAEAALYVP